MKRTATLVAITFGLLLGLTACDAIPAPFGQLQPEGVVIPPAAENDPIPVPPWMPCPGRDLYVARDGSCVLWFNPNPVGTRDPLSSTRP